MGDCSYFKTDSAHWWDTQLNGLPSGQEFAMENDPCKLRLPSLSIIHGKPVDSQRVCTLGYFNIAIQNTTFADDLPIKT